jgi:diguanylate cyclase (GGDEF)-like protein/PAS domain S-box-containing protein
MAVTAPRGSGLVGARRPHGPVLRALLAPLPKGTFVSEVSWHTRHRSICALLWLHVLILPVVAMVRGATLGHAMFEAVLVAPFAAGAVWPRFGRGSRSTLATLGLVLSSAILTHLLDGLIEMHFYYFVVVVVVSLYQSWVPFLAAVGFVVLQHAVVGAVAPTSVFNHPAAQRNPLGWSLVHGGFILAQSVACLACWRVSENALGGERRARDGLDKTRADLARAQELARVGSWEWDVMSNSAQWSDQMYELAGVDQASQPVTGESFLAIVHEADRARVGALITTAVEARTPLDYECTLVRPDGSVRVIHTRGDVVVADDGTVTRLFGTCQDISERRRLHDEIFHLAFHDPLTGLANRRMFVDRLERALATQQRSAATHAVLFLDIDDFKAVNDTLGHKAGDDLLVEVGQQLRGSARSYDTVARWGGDEFALLLENIDRAGAMQRAERIQANLREVLLDGKPLHASIGVAMAEGAADPDDLLRDADAAMYTAKRAGDGRAQHRGTGPGRDSQRFVSSNPGPRGPEPRSP